MLNGGKGVWKVSVLDITWVHSIHLIPCGFEVWSCRYEICFLSQVNLRSNTSSILTSNKQSQFVGLDNNNNNNNITCELTKPFASLK